MSNWLSEPPAGTRVDDTLAWYSGQYKKALVRLQDVCECLEEAADWLDNDLAHAPDTPVSMADRDLIRQWRAALERAA